MSLNDIRDPEALHDALIGAQGEVLMDLIKTLKEKGILSEADCARLALPMVNLLGRALREVAKP